MDSSCYACGSAILDRYLLEMNGKSWHQACLNCADCRSPLSERCYHRDGKFFCLEDFSRRFGRKCSGCNRAIASTDLVQKISDNQKTFFYHSECFACSACSRTLLPGCACYRMEEGRFLCPEDYAATFAARGADSDEESNESCGYETSQSIPELFQQSKSFDEKDLTPDCAQDNSGKVDDGQKAESLEFGAGFGYEDSTPNSDTTPEKSESQEEKADMKRSPSCITLSGTKRRGPRTTIKAKQLDTLKAAFAITPKPTRHIREQLAQDTGLTMRVIQVWFQNRRSKERRLKQMDVLVERRHFFDNALPRRIREAEGNAPTNSYFGDFQAFYSPAYDSPTVHVPPSFGRECYNAPWTGNEVPINPGDPYGKDKALAGGAAEQHYGGAGVSQQPPEHGPGSEQMFFAQANDRCYSGMHSIKPPSDGFNAHCAAAVVGETKPESSFWHQS